MKDLLGTGADLPAIATYLNPMDFRYVIPILGAIEADYKACPEHSIRAVGESPFLRHQMFYSSPRNRLEVLVTLGTLVPPLRRRHV